MRKRVLGPQPLPNLMTYRSQMKELLAIIFAKYAACNPQKQHWPTAGDLELKLKWVDVDTPTRCLAVNVNQAMSENMMVMKPMT